ncbi:MAG: hypothetical protein PF588_09200 [Candidatus Kapabacteria bacterium]|jgi:hypothetical protein|nr:hypothetical protein [Candidatus Kapabacteria bacterium]
MKYVNMRIISISFIASLVLILMSCSEPKIYKGGKEWKFSMKSSDQIVADTIYLKSFDEITDRFDIKSHWVRFKLLENGGSNISVGESGIEDGTWLSLTPRKINIPPYRSSDDYSTLTGMLPYPGVEYPISIGQKTNWELTPRACWEELEGKTVKGYIEVIDKIYYSNDIVQDSCWVLSAIGKSEVGEFSAKYYFSEKYGFIYFNYDFSDYTVEINLIGYNDNADSISILPELYYAQPE